MYKWSLIIWIYINFNNLWRKKLQKIPCNIYLKMEIFPFNLRHFQYRNHYLLIFLPSVRIFATFSDGRKTSRFMFRPAYNLKWPHKSAIQGYVPMQSSWKRKPHRAVYEKVLDTVRSTTIGIFKRKLGLWCIIKQPEGVCYSSHSKEGERQKLD